MKSSGLLEKKKVTYQDYAAWPDDGKRYEIIDGEAMMTPAPAILHQRVALKLSRLLGDAIKSAGEVFIAPCDVVFDEANVVQPDILLVLRENRRIVKEDNIRGAPDLVVEVLSESSGHRDLMTKRELYAKFGVPEYWIVDPREKTLDVLSLKGKGYQRAATFRNHDKVKSALSAQLQFRLSAIWP